MRRTLAVIFLTIFIDLIGVGMVVPVLPQLFGNPSSSAYMLHHGRESIKIGLILNGLLFSIYSFAQFIASPLLGQLSDRIGRRKVLSSAMFFTFVAQVGFAYSIDIASVFLLFVSRFIAGIASGNLPVAQAIIADTTPPEKRSSALGIIGAAFGIGLIFGPYLGGKLMTLGVAYPFYISGILAFVNCIFILMTLKETHVTDKNNKEPMPKLSIRAAFVQIKEAFAHKTLKSVFIVYFFMQLGFAVYISYAAVHLLHRFHLSSEHLGGYFTFAGISAVIAQVIVVRYVAKHHNEHTVISPALIMNSLGLAGIAFAHSFLTLYISTFVFAVGYSLVYANTSSLITNESDKDERGASLGYLGSIMALGLAIPPLFGGVISISLSSQSFLLLAAIIVFAASIYFRKYHYFHNLPKKNKKYKKSAS